MLVLNNMNFHKHTSENTWSPQKSGNTSKYVSANYYLKSREPQKPSTAFHNHDMLTLYFHIFPES